MARPATLIDPYPTLQSAAPELARTNRYCELLAALPAAERGLLYRAVASRGRQLYACGGAPLGIIAAVLVDRETAWPQWLAVEQHSRAAPLVGVPIAGLASCAGGCQTPQSAAVIRSAPRIDLGGLSAEVERALCMHYGLALTRGAALLGERRTTSSRAFQDGGRLGWLPGPRAS
jgi:hypothetical protein